MLFVDVLSARETFETLQESVAEEIAAVLRSARSGIVLRRIVTEPEPSEIEIWVELSSDEQFARHGRAIAERVAERIRNEQLIDVWVMFRIVPLSQAFLNGHPRARGHVTLD
ncbi:MAG: hypothetical protein ACKVVP_04015 [Chloroflexota bacterium]